MNFLSLDKIKYFFCLSLTLWLSDLRADVAGLGHCKVRPDSNFSGNLVATWQELDQNGNSIIQAGIGSGTTPTVTWSVTMISQNISPIFNMNPLIFSNQVGDMVVIWQFADQNGLFWVAASILQHDTTVWQTQILSDNTETAGFFDQNVALDESGNVFAIWSSTHIATGEIQIRCATTVVGSQLPWGLPQKIAP